MGEYNRLLHEFHDFITEVPSLFGHNDPLNGKAADCILNETADATSVFSGDSLCFNQANGVSTRYRDYLLPDTIFFERNR